MAEHELQAFLHKVRQLQEFVALSEREPALRQALRDCGSHHAVVALARRHGFEIGRRWGDPGPVGKGSAANLLEGECPPPGQERVTVLLEVPGLRLERIHSCDCATPAGQWYDQSEEEWVLLLRGSARLQFADEAEACDLAVGDSLRIAPHRRHRVVATDPDPGTLWLALFWSGSR